MTRLTVFYLVFFIVLVAVACGRTQVDSTDPAIPVATPKAEQVAAASEPVTDPTPAAEVQVIPTPLPVAAHDSSGESTGSDANPRNTPQYGSGPGSYYNPYYGQATLEERIAAAEVIAIARMATVVTGVEEFEIIDHTGEPTSREEFVGVLRFTFNVSAYLKNSGTGSPTQLIAVVKSWHFQLTREDAQAVADRMLESRDTQWDNRDAVIFLVRQHSQLPATNSDNVFYMSVIDVIDWDSARGDEYSIASKRNKIWLPEADRGSSGQSSSERWFLTDVPASGTGQSARSSSQTSQESPAISQSTLVKEINRVTAEMNADPRDGYAICIAYGYYLDREDAWAASQGDDYRPEYFLQDETGSGLPAGTGIIPIDFLVVNENWKDISWFEGDDAGLFAIGDVVRSWESVSYDYPNSFDAIGGKFLVTGTLNRHNIETTRPMPKGEYAFVQNNYGIFSAPCEHYKEVINWTVTVTAPAGTLHEAFFDPVTLRQAQGRLAPVGADSTNGVLKPTAFTDGNSASATLQRIAWEAPSTGSGQAGAVKLKLSPHTGLANHVLDFIGLDGKVILSLDADDATVDAANNTLSWPATYQPWKDGDKLMLRIHNGPVTPIPTPAAPMGLTATAGAGSVTLTWDNPSDSTITGYEYQMRWAGVAWQPWKAIPNSGSSTTSHTATGLTGSTEYRFHVRAVNASGPGTAAPNADPWYVAATPSVPPPAAPTGLTATAGRESVKLSWNNPSDSTITRYEYQARWTGVGWQSWKAIPNSDSSTTSHLVTGLTGGTEYRFHVRAVNASGAGPQAPNAPPWYVSATPGKR